MSSDRDPNLVVALISEVFFGTDASSRLTERLREARACGADLAVLPELPLNPWSPATTTPRDDDAEPPGGPRTRLQAMAAREAGIALLGGAIIVDPTTGSRFNTALLFDETGVLCDTYRKVHVPEEPGFWETSHYACGNEPPHVRSIRDVPLGVQICSDANRPVGSQLLAAQGAAAILIPRATEAATYHRWRPVFIANALTCGCYVLSVNRPEPEQDVLIGGPSIAVAPDGDVLHETTDTMGLVTIETAVVRAARIAYPGYLPRDAVFYARAWDALSQTEPAPA